MSLTLLLAPTNTVPPPTDPMAVLLAQLEADLAMIRNNSRSTYGDPRLRLKSNVGRAQKALDRIAAYRSETP